MPTLAASPQHQAAGSPPAHPSSSVGERLDVLFATVPVEGAPAGTRRYTNATAARALRAKGHPVSSAGLARLRNDSYADACPRLLGAVASLFGVSPEYFSDDDHADSVMAQLELFDALSRLDELLGTLR